MPTAVGGPTVEQKPPAKDPLAEDAAANRERKSDVLRASLSSLCPHSIPPVMHQLMLEPAPESLHRRVA